MKQKGTLNVPAVYVILRKNGKILFTFREHTGFMDGTFSLPSGHVEDDENVLTAAARETAEEVGVAVPLTALKLVHSMHRKTEKDVRVDFFFESEEWEGEPFNNEPHKHGDIAWFTFEELQKQPLMDYQAVALDLIKRGVPYSEWGWESVETP